MKYLIDSSAWIEYLNGSNLGKEVSTLLSDNNEIYVIPLIIAEVVSKVKRNSSDAELAYDAIIKNAKIFETTPKTAKEAGLLHTLTKKKVGNFSLADALIICSARVLKAKIISKDSHLKSLVNLKRNP